MARPKRRRRRRWFFLLLLLALLGGGGYFWKKRNAQEKPTEVDVEEVTRRDITESVVATGYTQPVTSVVINPEVAGEIVSLPVKEGQVVKEGDVLVKIKEDDYQASRDLSEASYQGSLAQLKLSQANRDKAITDFKRTEALFKDRLVSEAEHLAVKTAAAVAQASFEASGHGVSQAKASLERAVEQLSKTIILAPIDGTVVQLRSEKGERVVGTSLMSGTEIMKIAQLDHMEARVEVGEVDVVLIQVGQSVRLEADAFRDEEFTGEVSEIANASTTAAMSNAAASMASNQQATKFQVKVRVNEKTGFRPGMSVTAYIETRSAKDVLAVPLQSVTTRSKLDKDDSEDEEEEIAAPKARKKKSSEKKVDEIVFLVEGNKAKHQTVERGISNDDYIEIKSGLEEGQTVVTGSYRAIHRDLEDDSLIEVKEVEKKP